MWGATSAWSGPAARASMTLHSDCGQNDRRSSDHCGSVTAEAPAAAPWRTWVESIERLQQQGQWAGPGAIRDHETDPLAVQLSLGESRADETTDRLRRKHLSDAANGGRPCWVARICPVVPF